MSIPERLLVGHLPERHQLLSQLATEEENLNRKLWGIADGNRNGLVVQTYAVPQILQIDRLTRARGEKRFDFELTRQEINNAPPVISDLFDELGIEEGEGVHNGVVLPYFGKPNEDYFHFAWVISPNWRLPNRVGIAMPSDEQLPVFMIASDQSNGRAHTVRTDFVETGSGGFHDSRAEAILLEAARWLPQVIQQRAA